MTQLYTGRNNDWEEHLFPCDASDGDYLRVYWDPEDDDEKPEWRYLGIESGSHIRGFRRRLKAIWYILRGKPIWVDDVILNAGVTRELWAFLGERIAPPPGWERFTHSSMTCELGNGCPLSEHWYELTPDPVVTAAVEEIDDTQ